jgi:DNA-binding transcriptional LysR family regulator
VAIANKEKFQLRIGLTHLFQSYFKPLLLELYKRHPQAEINISVTDSSHLETMLNEGTIDLALIQRPYRSEGFDFVSFDPVRLVAVISKKCLPQVPQSPFDYQALEAFPLVLLHRAKDSGTYEMLIDLFRKAGVIRRLSCISPSRESFWNGWSPGWRRQRYYPPRKWMHRS